LRNRILFLIFGRLSVVSGRAPGGALPCRRSDVLWEPARKKAGDAGDRVADVAREQRDRTDDSDGDDGEDDAVLRHGLPLLAVAEPAGGLHGGELRGDEELQHG
jgi:hypothetical protein